MGRDEGEERDEAESTTSDSLLRQIARIDEVKMVATPAHHSLGSRIGRFVVRGELGRGGMGVVYRAHDEALGRSVALKVLPAIGGARAEEARARLLREARAAAALEHPNVVSIYEVGEDQGLPFIAMELVTGQNLRERMRDSATLDEKLGWLADIAEALAAAHESGIVHRDVKPENVMIRRDGRVKVLDFGIARQVSAPVDPSAPTAASDQRELGTITEEGVRVGTPRYMAPEQLKGEKLDGRSDQFAWGVLAYELLAGRPPWEEGDSVALIASILSKDPVPLAEAAPGVRSPIGAVVARALSKSADRRFDSMREVVAALRPATPTHVPGGRRLPRALWIGGVGLALVAAGWLGVRQPGLSSPPAASATTIPSAAKSESARGVAITDLPLPRSSVPEALAAYKAGMQALRDGAVQASEVDFAKARKLDPAMGAAFLRAVEYPISVSAAQRELITQAVELRGGMTEHDARLLDAVAPCWQARSGADRWCVGRITELTRSDPLDADFSFWRVEQLEQAGAWAEARDEARRTLRLDPRFARVSSWLATAEWFLGDAEGALRDVCMDGVGSTNCFITGGSIQRELGHAAEMEEAMRRFIQLAPDADFAYAGLATALVCAGRAPNEVGAALARRDELTVEADRPRMRLSSDATLAYWRGDFAAAEHAVDEMRAVVRGRHELGIQGDAAAFAVEIARETGRAADAAVIAQGFLDRMGSLVPAPQADADSLGEAFYAQMLLALRRGGKLSKEAARAERDRWIAGWEARLGSGFRPYLWLAAYAELVDDADDAREALEALPRFGGLPKEHAPDSGTSGAIGRIHLLAGRIDEAISWLERDVQVCALEEHVQARLWLAQAFEQKGDKEKACEAYARVLKRWGNAKPKSVTADEARKRSKALGCGR